MRNAGLAALLWLAACGTYPDVRFVTDSGSGASDEPLSASDASATVDVPSDASAEHADATAGDAGAPWDASPRGDASADAGASASDGAADAGLDIATDAALDAEAEVAVDAATEPTEPEPEPTCPDGSQPADVEPGGSPLVTLSSLPKRGAVLPRDRQTNRAIVRVAGTVSDAGWRYVRARVRRNGVLELTVRAPICAGEFSLELPIEAELASRDVSIELRAGALAYPVAAVSDLVAGDVHIIDGQSNAAARKYRGSSDAEKSPWVRSFGTRSSNGSVVANDDHWHHAEGDANGGPGAIGQWALRCFRQVALRTGVPQAVINNANSGLSIVRFIRPSEDDVITSTHLGRLRSRMERAGLMTSALTRSFYQGEADDTMEPATYTAHVVEKFGFYESDFNSAHTVVKNYVFQTRRISDAKIANEHRKYETLFANTAVVSTNGIDGRDGRHYTFEKGYEELGDRIYRLIMRDVYGGSPQPDTDRIMPLSAWASGDVITVLLDHDASDITIDPAVIADFVLPGATRTIASMAIVDGNLQITLGPGAGMPTEIQYLGHDGPGPWIQNARGVGLLSFILPVATLEDP